MDKIEITEVENLLSQDLDADNPQRLMSQVAKLAGWIPRVSLEKRKLERELAEQRSVLLPNEGTVQEKEIELDSLTAELNQKLGVIKDAEKHIYSLLSLSQSFLKYHAEEVKRLN